MGLTTDLQRICNEGLTKATVFESHRSPLHLEKQNFHTTLQLITRNAVNVYVLVIYNGDSFCFTRHPLITLKWYINLI